MSLAYRMRLERGQILVVSALILPILLGFAAIAVDLGSYAAERRTLQNDADAIALAGAKDLPNSSSAINSARTWMSNNGVDQSNVQVTVTGGSVTPQVHVVISKSHGFAFIGLLGVGAQAVGARATAAKVSFGGNSGIVPWSITQATLDSTSPGQTVTIKYDSTGGNTGNFGAIRIDGSGSSEYEWAATYGSETTVCAVSQPNCTTSSCPGSYPNTCAEDAPECDGPDCAPKTGNMTGPTRNAVDFRMQYTSSQCDSFSEVFTQASAHAAGDPGEDLLAENGVASSGGRLLSPPYKQPTDTPTPIPTHTNTPVPPTNTPVPPTSTPVPPTNTPQPTSTAAPTNTPAPTSTPGGPTSTPTVGATATAGAGTKYTINPQCNPWASGGACPPGNNTTLCSRRVIIIPVIDEFGNGSSDPVTIQKFALLFLEGYDNGKCQGSSCEIHARFVNADITTGALAGAYDPNAPIQFAKLVE